MSKKVSIIVCAFNVEKELGECLDSLERQRYGDIEIIIVNDASTDGTLDLAKRFRSRTEKNVKVITNQSNLGVAGSRNVGIKNAAGNIIAFTDADCVVDEEWISELVRMYERENAAAVGGGILDSRIDSIWNLSSKGLNFVASSEGYVSYIQGCNMSFDSSVFKEYAFNDEIKYGYEETLLCDQLIDAGYNIYYNPRAVVHHKHKADLPALLKQKYLRGVSSIWYRKKRKKFVMFKRHFVLLVSLLCIPLSEINEVFLYAALFLLLMFLASLLRDEMMFGNDVKKIILSFPFVVLIEFAHFAGSCAGVIKFRLAHQPAE